MFQVVTGILDLVGLDSAPAQAVPERSPGRVGLLRPRCARHFSPWRRVVLGLDLGLLSLAALVWDHLLPRFAPAVVSFGDATDGEGATTQAN
jgi:hypothetical protein